jgi:hypothetical protein
MTYGQASSAKRGVPNVLHASADPKEAEQEIAHWFSESEMVEYVNVHEQFTQFTDKKK